jgi:hypothetical protein
MKCRPYAKLRQSQGQSVVELALVLPLLVVLMLGLVDLSRAIQAYNIIANMSREGANLALRTATSIDPQHIMNSLANTAQPLAMTSKGMMYMTKVHKIAGDIKTEQIPWGNNQNGTAPPSKYGADTVPASIRGAMNDGDIVYVFEVFYKYDSLFKASLDYGAFSPQLHSISIF